MGTGGSITKIFLPIELNDLWSKIYVEIYVDDCLITGATFILRWSFMLDKKHFRHTWQDHTFNLKNIQNFFVNILHFFEKIWWQNTSLSESKEFCTYKFFTWAIEWKIIWSEIPKWVREWLFIGLAEYDVTFGKEAQIEALRESSIYFPLTHSFLPFVCIFILQISREPKRI